mmetsp:Transcript_108506/g.221577  ORF Transcript_108506/g.221577 Transcript_108506/m.221577 type:complete len:491 (-) Transcript_108506:1842-3314(-)
MADYDSSNSDGMSHRHPATSHIAPLEIEGPDAAPNGNDGIIDTIDDTDYRFAHPDGSFDDSELVNPLVGGNHGSSSSSSSSPHPSKPSAAAATAGDDHHGAGPPGSASTPQVIVNIIISFVGAGLLGVPNAFAQSGWLLGSVTLLTVSALNVYAMLCLPRVQKMLQKQYPSETIQSYGDLGRVILGQRGERVIFVCLGISQFGFATAYIIFIAANLHSIYGWSRFVVCFFCLPGLLGLVQFREMKSLAPFSTLANVSNFCALSAVLFQDYEHYTPHNDTIHKANPQGVLYVIAVTIYSMEGVALVLSLRSSCKQPGDFPFLLISTLTAISLFMVVFGSAGYWAFGDATVAPITLNMASHWSATFVKCALCLGLYLTYPVMMFPLWTIVEPQHASFEYRLLARSSLVCFSAVVAYSVPNFGKFLSLVGSSICTLLGFVFPSYFHLYTMGKELPVHQRCLDLFLLVGGFAFGCAGTYTSVVSMMNGEEPDGH